MSWIKVIEYAKADGKLKKIYNRIKGPDGHIDNVLKIHSLRPHTLLGHMALYKNVLHNSNNTLDKWYLEAMGVYVSHLNGCTYCFDHHFAGFKRLLENDAKAEDFRDAVLSDKLDLYFDGRNLLGIRYAYKLTKHICSVIENDVSILRFGGFTDGEILEINQVVSYFNYVNRSVVGLGVNTSGDILGLSPNSLDDPENWSHK